MADRRQSSKIKFADAVAIARALLSLSAREDDARQEWQPIETAPKESGHYIIGWCKQWHQPICVRWLSGLNRWNTAFQPFQPTHWQPLPSPPLSQD
jgi:hypothetical protein